MALSAFEARLASAFLLALLGGLHCAAMCGGFVAAMHANSPARAARTGFAIAYNAGRILSYSAAGGLIGLLGAGLYASDVPNLAALELAASGVRRAAAGARAGAWIRPAVGVALVLFATSDLAHAARIAGWDSPAVARLASFCHG